MYFIDSGERHCYANGMYDPTLNDYDWTVTEAAKQTGRNPEWIRRKIRSDEVAAKEIDPKLNLYLVSVSSMLRLDASSPRRVRKQ